MCLSVYVNEGKRRLQDFHPEAYLYEVNVRLEHASVDGLVLVGERDHVEGHCLWHSQDDGQDPDGEDLNCGKEGNSDPLHSAPGRYGPVPEPQKVQPLTKLSDDCSSVSAFQNRDITLKLHVH